MTSFAPTTANLSVWLPNTEAGKKMKIDKSFLRSKLARRIFLMFVICALLPIAGLFILSYKQVTAQLNSQNHKRLKQSVKLYSLSVCERLLFLEAEMQILTSSLVKINGSQKIEIPTDELADQLRNRFQGLQLFDPDLGTKRFWGQIKNPPKPNPAEIEHIKSGKTAIKTTHLPNSRPRIFLLRLINLSEPNSGFLLGEINPDYLWGAGHDNALPLDVQVAVFDDSKNLLFSSLENADALAAQIERWTLDAKPDVSEMIHNNKKYLTSHRTLFLKPNFLVSNWTIVLFQSAKDVLAPLSDFKKMFLLVALTSLLIVLLLSIVNLRKSLVPLELLKEGTRRVAMKDFDNRVKVQSNDEFEELADAFNEMSSQLSRQFKTLITKAEIDRAILSSLETEKIVKTVMTRMRDCFSFDNISISLIDSAEDHTARVYNGSGNQKTEISKQSIRIESRELQTLDAHPKYLFIKQSPNMPTYLRQLAKEGSHYFLILPVFLKEKLSAVIAFGQSEPMIQSEEDLNLARQMADQVAVALANSNLIEELNRLNWGTLKALARTVDAKSSWTAGHSERVADIALKIGRSLGLDKSSLINLQRAAFLHDIGKIGVPVAILDKPGKLSYEEFNIIKAHPRMGGRILEPIKAYAEIIPMVVEHHERFDGKGYPDGLNGSSISLGARILAVADVFDALKSDRPYRNGMPFEQVIAIIKQEAGQQFDPDIVNAFLTVVEWEEVKAA
jgi:HD-GYP domain-containing protein (c-di-GMP phosphodiesterase class II)